MVVPITSAEGAVAAITAAVLGKPLSAVAWASLAAVIVGVGIAAWSDPGRVRTLENRDGRRPVLFAILSALCFGVGLGVQGKAGQTGAIAIAIAPPTVMGALLVARPTVGQPATALAARCSAEPPRSGRGRATGLRLLHLRRARLDPDRGCPICSVRDDRSRGQRRRPPRATSTRTGIRIRRDRDRCRRPRGDRLNGLVAALSLTGSEADQSGARHRLVMCRRSALARWNPQLVPGWLACMFDVSHGACAMSVAWRTSSGEVSALRVEHPWQY